MMIPAAVLLVPMAWADRVRMRPPKFFALSSTPRTDWESLPAPTMARPAAAPITPILIPDFTQSNLRVTTTPSPAEFIWSSTATIRAGMAPVGVTREAFPSFFAILKGSFIPLP